MRINIISDIKSKGKSIIPYGLNLAKYLDLEVDITHAVDTRIQQGVTSMFGDSQSVTPGRKLSHSEVIEHEMNDVEKKLDQLLSGEASRLNYPVKINVDVDVNDIERKIKEISENDPSSLFVVNQEVDHYHFDSKKELIDINKRFNGFSLFVPSEIEFERFSHVLLVTDFGTWDFDAFSEVMLLLEQFKPVINLVGDEESVDPSNLKRWKMEIEAKYPDMNVNHHLLDNKNFDNDIVDYIGMIEPDLIVIFDWKQGLIDRILKKELVLNIIEEFSIPVLFYSNSNH